MLISAFLKLSRFYPDYTLTIIGNGEWYDLFKKKYRQYTSINFPGYTRDLLSFIKQSFFYIQPSRSEASGTAVLEMMYC
ncbi:MAG: glycosyltransferase [Candidatus Peribacteria bacterium]|nr:MAG: glycosyltransferase [Candidatus Peribacteria bacterium]